MTTMNTTGGEQGEGLVRPVQCGICSGQMYYINDSRHRPEVRVEIYEDPNGTFEAFYAHKDCWTSTTRSRAGAASADEVREALQWFKEVYDTVTYLGGKVIDVAVDSDLAKKLLAAATTSSPAAQPEPEDDYILDDGVVCSKQRD